MGAEVLKFDGAFAPRILRFDEPYGPKGGSGAMGPLRGPGSKGSKGSKGGGVALWGDKFYNSASRNKNHTTGLCPWEMHPFCLRHLPRRGRFALRLASELISISRHSAAKTSPSGGSTAAGGDRGAFPTGRRPGCMVFLPPTGGIYTGARRAPTFIYHLPFTIYHFSISSRLPAHRYLPPFPTYYSYRDPSLTLRMTVDGGKAPAPSDV